MVSGKRTLKRLDITSQEVENVAIPGIQQVHMFYPSLDGNTLYFVGQAEGKTILPLCAGHAGTDAAHVPQTARPDH